MAIEKLNLRADSQDERFAQLKQLYPEIFSDGNLNIEALKEACGLETEEDGYYGLYWPGKNEAKRLARKEATGTLEPVEGDGVNEDTTHNIYIEGDNLEVLRTLKKSYQNRIKMIYIDPPYNTGNDFIYPDNYQEPVEDYLRFTGQMDDKGTMLVANPKSSGKFHRRWLNMMYPRLQLARELLTDDGVIFISIDDNEQANLKLLCDEVFGEGNFITCLKWKRKKQPSFLSKHIAVVMEYILVYASDSEVLEKLSIDGTSDATKKVVNLTNKVSERLFKSGCRVKLGTSGILPKGRYTVKTSVIEYLDDVEYENGKTIKDIRVKAQFTCSQDKIDEFIDQKLLFITATKGLRRDVSEEEQGKRKSIVDLLLDWGDNQDSDTEMRDMFGKPVFSYTKPSKLISNLVKSNYTENSIILDFFSGSSTTAQSIFKLNAEDNHNRKFIMVQMSENLDKALSTASADEKPVIENAIELLEKINKPHNICELAKERIRRAGSKILEDAKLSPLNSQLSTIDIGFKVYRLAKSNFTAFENISGTDKSALNDLFAAAEKEPLTEGWKERKSSVIAELCLRHGFMLDSQITKCPEYTRNEVYKIVEQNEEKTMFVCLDEKLNEETAEKLKLEDGEKFICLDSAIGDQLKVQLADKGRIETI